MSNEGPAGYRPAGLSPEDRRTLLSIASASIDHFLSQRRLLDVKLHEYGEPLRQYVEDVAQVPIITMCATESMLGEWVFGLPAGSMEEEPIIMATVAALDGCRNVGIAHEASLIGNEYLRTARVACQEAGLNITR